MALNPNGSGEYKWNYKKGELELYGTILTMQEVQAREFNQYGNQPGRPRTWPDGNPVFNIRLGLADPNGNFRSVTFPEAGKKQRSGEKPSLHMDLYNLSNGGLKNLIGKTIHLWTWPTNPTTGQVWGSGNPRLFGVELVDVTYTLNPGIGIPDEFLVEKLLCNDGAHGGQPVVPPNPQMIQQPQVPPMQGQFYAAPTIQQQYQQAPPMQQQYQQAPMQQQQYQPAPQPAVQPQPQMAPAPQAIPMPQGAGAQPPMPTTQAMPPQQVGAPIPAGMDPAVAQAMQAVGAVNVQPVIEGPSSVYDDDIPFNGQR